MAYSVFWSSLKFLGHAGAYQSAAKQGSRVYREDPSFFQAILVFVGKA
jgi:hypothetical protein